MEHKKMSEPESLPPGTDVKASPRIVDLLKSEVIDERRLRMMFDVEKCETCGEEIAILGGSAPICAQCYLGVEHVTREGAELITNLDFNITEEEFDGGYNFFTTSEEEGGLGHTPEQFYKINARLKLNGYPVHFGKQHAAGMAAAVLNLVKEELLKQLPQIEGVDFLKEALTQGNISIDPDTRTIVVGVEVHPDGSMTPTEDFKELEQLFQSDECEVCHMTGTHRLDCPKR